MLEAPLPLLPLSALHNDRLHGLLGLMTDIDDTLTRDGAIEPAALQALADLRRAGVPVFAITGRPLGWSEVFANAWPLDAIVAENGAVALIPDGRGLRVEYAQDEPTRRANSIRLEQLAALILRDVPGALLAQDSPGRATDIAIDHSEFTRLSAAAIAQVVALMQAAGMQATVSSIHVNGWFGAHNKWTGAVWMVERLYQRALQVEVAQWLYVGDSSNDQLMFEKCPLSVGVANLMRFADVLHTWPGFITQAERGQGFAEVAARVLAARAGA